MVDGTVVASEFETQAESRCSITHAHWRSHYRPQKR